MVKKTMKKIIFYMCHFVSVCVSVCVLGQALLGAADRWRCRLVCEPCDRRDDTDGDAERGRRSDMYTHTDTHSTQ